jgi:hypothetical protein
MTLTAASALLEQVISLPDANAVIQCVETELKRSGVKDRPDSLGSL